MGIIIQLDHKLETRRSKAGRVKSDRGSANVLLFTGVRYERVPQTKKPVTKRIANRK